MTLNNDLLAERYGKSQKTQKRERRFWVVVVALTVLAFLSWAAVVTVNDAVAVKSKDLAFEVLDETQTRVRFEVTRPNSQAAVCYIQVLNQGFAVVGYKEFVIPAGEEKTSQHEIIVNTTELGVSGLVDSCRDK